MNGALGTEGVLGPVKDQHSRAWTTRPYGLPAPYAVALVINGGRAMPHHTAQAVRRRDSSSPVTRPLVLQCRLRCDNTCISNLLYWWNLAESYEPSAR